MVITSGGQVVRTSEPFKPLIAWMQVRSAMNPLTIRRRVTAG